MKGNAQKNRQENREKENIHREHYFSFEHVFHSLDLFFF
jgi:hypothetical protein